MSTLTMQSPFPRRFLAWIDERFPFANSLLFFSLYATAVLLGSFAANDGAIEIGVRELAGFLPVWCFFLLLRVYDEHKDYEADCQNYPERVLQRGLITLGHLKVVGGLAIATQLFGSLLLDGGFGMITMWWLAVFVYSVLMAKEFFVGEWLEKRLALYATSHMAIMPLALLWMVQIGAGQQSLPIEVGLLAALSFLSGGAFEVTRKLRAPEEEREEVDSYTKVFGVKGAPLVVSLLLGLSVVVLGLMASWIFGQTPGIGWFVALGAILVAPVILLMKFRSDPTPKTRKTTEAVVGLSMLASYIFMISVILAERGAMWGGLGV